jgi:hypothetical protein
MMGKMRKVFWLLTMFFIVSCSTDKNDNRDTLYQAYGVIREDANTGKLYVRSDNGKAIIPALSSLLSNDDRDRRVWMLFSTGDDISLDTVKVNVYEFLKITQIDVKDQTDESTSDEVYLQEIWIAQDYLTMIMDVTASSEISLRNHRYTMYSDMKVVNDTVRMEFKYDRNNDSRSSKFTKIIALKLDDKITNPNSIVLAIKYRSSTGDKEERVLYKK